MKLWRTMTWGEIKLFLREPLTVVFAFGFPLVMLLVLAGGVRHHTQHEPTAQGLMPWRGAPPLSYYVPGYIALAAAAVGLIMIPAHLSSYRERGVLRRFRAASIPASTIFGSQIAVQVVLSALGGLLVRRRRVRDLRPGRTLRTPSGRRSPSSSASPPSPPSACCWAPSCPHREPLRAPACSSSS